MEKNNSVSYVQMKYKKLGTINAVPVTTKNHKVRNENIQRYVSVKFPLIKVQNFKYERRDFTPAFLKITKQQQFLPRCYWMAC